MKSGIGLDCLAAGLQLLERGVNAIFEKAIGEAHEADCEQQERSGDEYEVNSDQHVAGPREVRTCAEVGDGTAKNEQQPFRRDSQEEKQNKYNYVSYGKWIGKTRRSSAAAENEAAYSPTGGGHARAEEEDGKRVRKTRKPDSEASLSGQLQTCVPLFPSLLVFAPIEAFSF